MILLWAPQCRHPATFLGGESQEKSMRGMEKQRHLQRDLCYFFKAIYDSFTQRQRGELCFWRSILQEKGFDQGWKTRGSGTGSGIYWFHGSRCFTVPLWVSLSLLVKSENWTRLPQGLPTMPLVALNLGLLILPILAKGSVLLHVREKQEVPHYLSYKCIGWKSNWR